MRPEPMSLPVDTDDPIQRSHGRVNSVTRIGWAPAATSLAGTSLAARHTVVGDEALSTTALVSENDAESFLYVANFGDGTIDVFDSHARQVNSFCDPNSPRSYGPLDVQFIDGSLFVTFVERDALQRDPFSEPEHGVITEFTLDGVALDRAEFCTRPRYAAS